MEVMNALFHMQGKRGLYIGEPTVSNFDGLNFVSHIVVNYTPEDLDERTAELLEGRPGVAIMVSAVDAEKEGSAHVGIRVSPEFVSAYSAPKLMARLLNTESDLKGTTDELFITTVNNISSAMMRMLEIKQLLSSRPDLKRSDSHTQDTLEHAS